MTDLETELGRIAAELGGVVENLREIARGIHPAILSEGGLRQALKTLARRAAIAVELDVGAIGRPPEAIEVAAYYVVSEALTNATRHARASVVVVDRGRVQDLGGSRKSRLPASFTACRHLTQDADIRRARQRLPGSRAGTGQRPRLYCCFEGYLEVQPASQGCSQCPVERIAGSHGVHNGDPRSRAMHWFSAGTEQGSSAFAARHDDRHGSCSDEFADGSLLIGRVGSKEKHLALVGRQDRPAQQFARQRPAGRRVDHHDRVSPGRSAGCCLHGSKGHLETREHHRLAMDAARQPGRDRFSGQHVIGARRNRDHVLPGGVGQDHRDSGAFLAPEQTVSVDPFGRQLGNCAVAGGVSADGCNEDHLGA
jgi:hypothetical protein